MRKHVQNGILIILFFSIQATCFSQAIPYFDSVFTGFFRRNSGGWTAGDATISVPLPDHRILWLFGDSYTVEVDTANNTLPCLFQVRNCIMVQDSLDHSFFKTILDTTQTGVNQTPIKLVPNDTTLFWPDHGYVWGDTVYLFYGRISNTDMSKFYGEYIAKLHYPDLHFLGLFPIAQNNGIAFGRSVMMDSVNNYLYIYGNKVNWIVWEPYVARCALNNPFSQWQYYTPSGWQNNADFAQKICDDPVSPNYSVIKNAGRYFLITQENGYLTCGLGREIYSYESETASGPFINKKLLYTEESQFDGNYLLTYNAQAHPFFTENDELLISYNVNDAVDTISPFICPSQCKKLWTDKLNADTYRPKFIRVPMSIITGSKEYNWIPSFEVVPNPVKKGEIFSILAKNSKLDGCTIVATDVSGRVLSEAQISRIMGNRIYLQAPSSPGIYIYQVQLTGNQIGMVRVVVQ